MNEPLVSIVIAVYNAGDYLRPSVQSILTQTYKNLEVLLVNDGSTDGCMESIANLRDHRIKIINQQNTGKAAVMNRALKTISGPFYAIQDADDISHPQRIELQIKCMLENPTLAAVFTGHEMILNGKRLAPQFAAKSTWQCQKNIENFRMPAHDPTAMFRMSIVRKIRYEPTLKIGATLDYILRVGELYPIMVLGECLYSYRVHFDSNIRRDSRLTKQMVQKIITLAYQRRGLGTPQSLHTQPNCNSRLQYREKENGVIADFMQSVVDLKNTGQNLHALKTALACLKLHPCDPYYYKPLVYYFAPMLLIEYYRKAKFRLCSHL